MKKLKIGNLVSIDKDLCACILQGKAANTGIIIDYETWQMEPGVYAKIFQVFVNREVHSIDELSLDLIEE